MSKAILVIDMPESCTKCQFCVIVNWPDMLCVGKDKRAIDYAPNKRQDWCPLKPLPENLSHLP